MDSSSVVIFLFFSWETVFSFCDAVMGEKEIGRDEKKNSILFRMSTRFLFFSLFTQDG